MLTAIIDYESGNLHSADKAFRKMAREVGAGTVIVTSDADSVARADRMYWGRQAPLGKLDKRVRDLVELADLGAKWSWAQVGTQQALRLELDAVKRIAVLSAEELAALRGVIPAIEEPG